MSQKTEIPYIHSDTASPLAMDGWKLNSYILIIDNIP